MSVHTPVLLNEVIEFLKAAPGKKFIDCTLNGGGHALAIAEKIQPDGKVLGIEWDPELLKQFRLKIENLGLEDRITTVNDSYVNIARIAGEHDFEPDGVLFDLGLSSWHYESSGRGFSFKRDELLDMRFDPSTKSRQVPANEIVNLYTVTELEQILRDYGEERFARQIAESIGRERKKKPIMTTSELVAVISGAVPEGYKHRRIHFATKTFQALRVVVNDELGNVKKGVEAAIRILKKGGRIVVISFQGHEDKIVREIFKEQVRAGQLIQPVRRTIRPAYAEQKVNPRARSAKMKIAEKV